MRAFFRRLWEGFRVVAEAIQAFMLGVMCTILYFTVLPFWSVMRLWDPLRTRLGADTYWEPYKNPEPTVDRFRRPF